MHDEAPSTQQPADPGQPAMPTQPVAPDPAASDPVAPSGRTSGPGRLRVGLVSGATVALAVGAVATALAASPATTTPATTTAATGTGTTSAWIAPAAMDGLDDGPAGVVDHGRFGAHGGFRDITISAISGTSVSLTTSDGWTRTVTVSDGVELTKGGQAIELSDLAVGDEIRLRQQIADDGTVTVTGIVVVVPSVAGQVSDLTATGFKVTGRDGAVWTITLTADTIYRYGAGNGTPTDIADGDAVLVQGTASGDNALTATSVTVRGDLVAGTVTATSATSITITDRAGESVTIHVDAETTYRVRGDADPSLADIAVDDVIAVSGRARTDGSIDADVVMEGGRFNGPGLGRPGFAGEGFGGPGFGGRGFDGPGFLGPDMPDADDDAEGTATDAG